MPKIPYKPEKSGENEDYEIVSFEDFCDKSPGSKTDLLTLNDNINYRLCFGNDSGDKGAKYPELGESSRGLEQTETSLSGPKNVSYKRKLSNSFAPFGKYNGKGGMTPLFSGVIPKPKEDGDPHLNKEHRYERFSQRRNIFQRAWDSIPRLGSGVMGISIVCAICIVAWWAVSGAVGVTWADEHYRKVWERAHPETVKAPISPLQLEKSQATSQVTTEHRYHDHNNLSVKNRDTKKTEYKYNKKNYVDRSADELKNVCAKTTDSMRFDCFPQGEASEAACKSRGCCWNPSSSNGVPYCFYPSQYGTYQFVNMTEDIHSMSVIYERARPSDYPDDFRLVRMDFKYMSDDVLQIKIYDAEHKRFEPMYPEIPMVPKTLTKPKYRVAVEGSLTGFKVIRNSDNVTIFNAQDVGGLILSDKFLQLSAVLPTDRVFGLGEKRSKFMNDMNWNTFAIFNKDRAPAEGMNLYGSQPFYMAVERDGNTHGTLLLNSNAMDIVLQPAPAITYRTTGGILNFFIFLGPTPKDVAAQYTELVGRPFMPPYWSLGFHLCKFDYGDLNTTRKVWQSNRDAGIPFDVQWNDIDYMKDHNDFTYNTDKFAGLPEFVNQLHSDGMHYIIIIDPGIGASEKPGTYPPFDRGLEMNIFVKNSTNQPFIGQVWNTGHTAFPDFTHPNSTDYWVEMMTTFHKKVPFDGAWIDMNEPSNFLDGSVYGPCAPENLPYRPHTREPYLREHTLCMDAMHYAGPHIDIHNLYGIAESQATNFALSEIRGKRPFIISRATFVGSGQYTGHWSGDIQSKWHDMQMTIPELLTFSLFGIPMMGADICGFGGNTTPELCKRWMQLGAFYPFSRNHNADTSIPQDPVSLGPEVVEASRKALRIRYRLLPYYYTLFWRAHVFGDTVSRPLFFEMPDQADLHAIDDQFLIGPHVMITAILEKGATSRKAQFPKPDPWYKLNGELRARVADIDEDNYVSVRGGAVLPLQEPAVHGPVNTGNTRSSPLQLLVAPDSAQHARGEIYWDDGDSINSYQEKKYSHIEFTHNGTELRSTVRWWGYGVPSLNQLIFFDQPPIKSINVNSQPCQKPCAFTYNTQTKVLEVTVTLSLDKPFVVSLVYKPKVLKTDAVLPGYG